jgi:hypothetical protein
MENGIWGLGDLYLRLSFSYVSSKTEEEVKLTYRRCYMKKNYSLLVGAILVALIAPVVAALPSDAVNLNREEVEQFYNRSIINPMDPGYVWGNPFALDLSGVNPAVFQNAAFHKDPGGVTSGNLYTTSINDFRNADPNAGASNTTKKAARVGLVNWP